MKTLSLLLLLSFAPGGERERGLQLYREGKFAEAATAFRAAIEQDGDSPELQWNLALASWRAGELAAAETAAEKYAALDKSARPELHAGLLGAVRHDEAMALAAKADAAGAAPPAGPDAKPEDPLPLLEQALAKANQARDYFVRGATATPTPELLRNTERSLRTIDELQKKIDELKKQREQQKQDDKQQDDKQDKKEEKDQSKDKKDQQDQKQDQSDDKQDQKDQKDQKPGDDKQGQDKKGQQDKQDGKPKDDPAKDGSGQEQPEPKPDPKDGKDQSKPGDDGKPEKPEPQSGKEDQEPKPGEQPAGKPGQPRNDAPGEGAEGRELTPEQAQRLLEQLKDLEDKMKASRARAKSGRRPVERDW